MQDVSDNYEMPFGKYEGKRIGLVPATYLDWLRGQEWIGNYPSVLVYITNNKQHIDKELQDEGRI